MIKKIKEKEVPMVVQDKAISSVTSAHSSPEEGSCPCYRDSECPGFGLAEHFSSTRGRSSGDGN